MATFLLGRELSRRFYWEVVRPLLDAHFPGMQHAAALIGPGSEVLGFDTEMSMDHDWYPKVVLFLREEEAAWKEPIKEMLAKHLPHTFLDFPVDAVEFPDEPGTSVMTLRTEGPVLHRVFPVTLGDFAQEWLGWSMEEPLQPAGWLSIPAQILRSLTTGAVHYDGVGELTRFRQMLAWYPHDLWLYLLASSWVRIEAEEHLMPRAGFVGDESGSAIMASRLTRDIMYLCFLMERQYAPYPKWFGSAFRQLSCAVEMQPLLKNILHANNWQERHARMGAACEHLAQMHNHLGLTEPLPEAVSNFHNRPFKVIHGDLFANALSQQISDPYVLRIAKRGLIGNIDQVSDNSELLSNLHWRESVKKLYLD
ncbi:MAG: DUF4037 domain-containing protein [Anaerolineales bacterium]|nr:DUF4037 domain-containing protein [Anaerolineales bacterium]